MSLASLFAAAGTTAGRVAAAMPWPLDPQLFTRIDNGRQPLPMDVAEQLVRVLGVDLGTVLSEAKQSTPLRGARVRVPVPPDPLRGDEFIIQPLGRTNEPPPAPGPQSDVSVWAISDVSPDVAMVRLDRKSATASSNFVGGSSTTPKALTFDGALVWAFFEGMAVALNPRTGVTMVTGSDADYVTPVAASFNAETNTLLVACAGGVGGHVAEVERTTGAILSTTPLVYDDPCIPVDIVAAGDTTYALGNTGLGGWQIFRFVEAVLDIASVLGTGDAVALAHDSVRDLFWVVTAAGSVWSTPRQTLVPVSQALTFPVGLSNPTTFTGIWRGDGCWYIAGVVSAPPPAPGVTPYLYRADDQGLVTAARVLAVSAVLADAPGFLWVAVPGSDLVHLLHPVTLDTALSVTVTSPQNLVLASAP